MTARRKSNEVDRKVCFYRIDAGLDAAGRPVTFDPGPFLTHIQSLPFNGIGSRYAPEDGGALCCWVDRCVPPYRLFFGKSSWDDRPLKEHNGARAELELGDNDALLHGVHAVLFFDEPYWLIGCEYNFHGPRITRLAKYLSEKSGCPGLTIVPLFRHDVAQKLAALRDVRLCSLRVHPSYVAALPKQPKKGQKLPPEELLDHARDVGSAYTVDVALRSGPRSPEKLPLALIGYMRQLVTSPEAHAGIVEAKLRGFSSDSGHVELIDLLHGHITETVRVRRAGSYITAPLSDAMYVAIEDAYERKRAPLRAAAGITFYGGGSDESGNSVA